MILFMIRFFIWQEGRFGGVVVFLCFFFVQSLGCIKNKGFFYFVFFIVFQFYIWERITLFIIWSAFMERGFNLWKGIKDFVGGEVK